MQRIFAFDPGTSAIGWAVLDSDGAERTLVDAGVRLFALARQAAVRKMRQRLKPEQRMKLRQRAKLRSMDLAKALAECGLLDVAETERGWECADGSTLRGWLAQALAIPLPQAALTRIVFNVHKHRGETEYGPEKQPARQFAERLLLFQSQWHAPLKDGNCRDQIIRIIFRRREPGRNSAGPPLSPLARIANREFKTVWHALERKFGMPDLVRFEAAVPGSGKAAADTAQLEELAARLAAIGRPPSRQNLLRARLFLQQSGDADALAECPLTGISFGFGAAFSAKVEIDHIRPVARNGAGGKANLMLCMAKANREKGAGTWKRPEADSIAPNPPRSRADAADADALRQSLRLAIDHVKLRTPQAALALVSPKTVAAARNKWLGAKGVKDRSDLRHHAVDAMVLAALPDGKWDGAALTASVCQSIAMKSASLLVSVRPEHGRKGQLHDDTRYGRPGTAFGNAAQVHVTLRKPVGELTPAMRSQIADPWLKGLAAQAGVGFPGSAGRARRVKIIRRASGAMDIFDRFGRFTGAVLPADNHHLDIVQMRDGKWRSYCETRHAVAQPDWKPSWEQTKAGGKLVMRLHKGDMLEIAGDNGEMTLMTVVRLNGSSGLVHLNVHHACACGDDPATKPKAFAPASLQKRKARAVKVSPLGVLAYAKSNILTLECAKGPDPADLGQRARTPI